MRLERHNKFSLMQNEAKYIMYSPNSSRWQIIRFLILHSGICSSFRTINSYNLIIHCLMSGCEPVKRHLKMQILPVFIVLMHMVSPMTQIRSSPVFICFVLRWHPCSACWGQRNSFSLPPLPGAWDGTQLRNPRELAHHEGHLEACPKHKNNWKRNEMANKVQLRKPRVPSQNVRQPNESLKKKKYPWYHGWGRLRKMPHRLQLHWCTRCFKMEQLIAHLWKKILPIVVTTIDVNQKHPRLTCFTTLFY